MQTRQFIMWTFAAVLAIAATALTACGGSDGDKAGGADKANPRVLTMAVPSGGKEQVTVFADEVRRLSEGTLEIRFKERWRLGEPLYEAGTLEDVKAGKVDMAWVGARAFDTVGVKSFQALLAPLLVDSYALEAKVFEEGIPNEMLEAVEELDLVGIGVLPGPMRKVLGVSRPFVEPADFAGQVVGIQDSAVAKQTLDAVGSTPKSVPAEAPLDGLDAYEQQLASIAGNSYDANAKYVTSNLNLWPRPLVIVMGNKAYDSLTEEQQSVLRDAAEAAIPKALEASRAEDEEAVATLCRRGMSFATASASDLAELRAAFEPVYAQLTSDPETRSYVDAIAEHQAGDRGVGRGAQLRFGRKECLHPQGSRKAFTRRPSRAPTTSAGGWRSEMHSRGVHVGGHRRQGDPPRAQRRGRVRRALHPLPRQVRGRRRPRHPHRTLDIRREEARVQGLRRLHGISVRLDGRVRLPRRLGVAPLGAASSRSRPRSTAPTSHDDSQTSSGPGRRTAGREPRSVPLGARRMADSR